MHKHEHEHEHPLTADEHDLPEYGKRAFAIQSLLVEKGILTADEIRRAVEAVDARTPALGAQVVDPRGVLKEFGLELDPDVEVWIYDSTADMRYLVIPVRPPGTEPMSEEELAGLVTQFSEIFILGNQQGCVFVCTLKDYLVPDARLHFRHVQHQIPLETETIDDLTLHALIGQKIHAASASRG